MLQTYSQYNVGVMIVRFFQLYSLSKVHPDKYGHIKIGMRLEYDDGGMFYFELINRNTYKCIEFEDLPTSVAFTMIHEKPSYIALNWHEGRREDKLVSFYLNEDTGVISAIFYCNEKLILKSSDGRVEYLANGVKHRPQNEEPVVITAEGVYEFWENGEHIRTGHVGKYIKG